MTFIYMYKIIFGCVRESLLFLYPWKFCTSISLYLRALVGFSFLCRFFRLVNFCSDFILQLCKPCPISPCFHFPKLTEMNMSNKMVIWDISWFLLCEKILHASTIKKNNHWVIAEKWQMWLRALCELVMPSIFHKHSSYTITTIHPYPNTHH